MIKTVEVNFEDKVMQCIIGKDLLERELNPAMLMGHNKHIDIDDLLGLVYPVLVFTEDKYNNGPNHMIDRMHLGLKHEINKPCICQGDPLKPTKKKEKEKEEVKKK